MNKYKKPGIPLNMAIDFQKKMVYVMRIADIEVKTLAKHCDLALSTVDWILRRPDHRVTMIQYLALCNAMDLICDSKFSSACETYAFNNKNDDSEITKYLKAGRTIDELMKTYSEWVEGADIDG